MSKQTNVSTLLSGDNNSQEMANAMFQNYLEELVDTISKESIDSLRKAADHLAYQARFREGDVLRLLHPFGMKAEYAEHEYFVFKFEVTHLDGTSEVADLSARGFRDGKYLLEKPSGDVQGTSLKLIWSPESRLTHKLVSLETGTFATSDKDDSVIKWPFLETKPFRIKSIQAWIPGENAFNADRKCFEGDKFVHKNISIFDEFVEL